MKKLFLAFAALVCLSLTSCTKTVIAHYGYDGRSLEYVIGYESEAQSFLDACEQTSNAMDGTTFTESEYINAMRVVVLQYDNRHIRGPFKIWKDDVDNVIKTFNMQFADN